MEILSVADRRTFLAASGAAALSFMTVASRSAAGREANGTARLPKAIAFDGFPIIDPRPVAARAEELFPGHGESLWAAWRTRQFEYTWLRTLGGQYVDFWQTTQDALTAAATSIDLALRPDTRDSLMHAYLELKAWPDVLPVLEKLRGAGIRLAFLSNFTAKMLDAALGNSGLRGF